MRARFVLLVVLLGGCYHPKIGDGALRCGPGALCPDGYTCNTDVVCVRRGGGGVDLGGSDAGPVFSGRIARTDLTGMTGILECSSKTGEIKLRNGATETEIVLPAADGFSRLTQTAGPALGVWSFQALFIPAGIAVKPASDSDAIPVFAAVGDLGLEGSVDWRGFGGFGGTAGQAGKELSTSVAAGGLGGTGDGGGGGGGHADVGQTAPGSGGGAGGAAYGTPDLRPIFDGSGGGGGGTAGGRGGSGGGGIVLLSLGELRVKGKIDVSGNVGFDGSSAGIGGGGGGGSGGSILLSGATVKLQVGHELAAKGGKGGLGTGTGTAGGDGAAGRVWIGGALNVDGSTVSDPMPTLSASPLASLATQ